MRGIVVSTKTKRDESGFTIKGGFDPLELRRYLLYWDKIDFPLNNIVVTGNNAEIKYLENVGVLQRSAVYVSSYDVDTHAKIQLSVFQNNNEKEKGCWSLAQGNEYLYLPESESILTRNIQVELYNSIPVPTNDVSLEDILIFKRRRYDELQELRVLMDDMYLSIMSSPDKDLAKDSATKKLVNKIKDINGLMNESKFQRVLSSMKVELDWSAFVLGGVTAHSVNSSIWFTLFGAIGSAAITGIKVGSEMSLKPKGLPDNLKDYAYLYYQNKELFK